MRDSNKRNKATNSKGTTDEEAMRNNMLDKQNNTKEEHKKHTTSRI